MKTPDNTPLRSSSTALPASAKPLALLGGLLALSALCPAPAWAAAEPITACAAEPTDMTITFGDVVDCNIDVAGDSDLFRFQGAANSVVVLSLLDTTGGDCDWPYWDPCPKADVFPPGFKPGDPPLVTLGPGGHSIEQLLAVSGKYTIRIRDDGDNQTENYRIGLERLFPASPTEQPISFGSVITKETIDPTPDQDFYTFDSLKDAYITLTLTDVTGGNCYWGEPCPVARVFGPDQALVATLGAGTQSKDLSLPLDGTYIVRLYDDGNNQNETYNLGLQCVFPPDGHTDCSSEPPPLFTCNGLTPTIRGTAKSERITGTPGNDVIVGLGGNDRILGLGGNDVICGNSDQATAGSDTLLGGEGNDTLIGNGMLLGEAGNDSLKGGNARDSLLGGPGDDTLDAQGGDDLAIGGAGNDKLLGGAGANDLCDKDASDLTPATGCELRFTP